MYTLGFLSILSFGVILTLAGYIVSVILDDLLKRCERTAVYRETVGAICLFVLAGSWLLFIAWVAQSWKHDRLGDDVGEFDLRDGYWFAFITTTTGNNAALVCVFAVPVLMNRHAAHKTMLLSFCNAVGLGDYYMEPAVILLEDVFLLSLVFLIGFTFLSAFLAHLVVLLSPHRPTWFGLMIRQIEAGDEDNDQEGDD